MKTRSPKAQIIRPSIVLVVVLSFFQLGGLAENSEEKKKALDIDAIVRGLNNYAEKAESAETTAQRQDVLQRMLKEMPANVDGRTFSYLCKVGDVKRILVRIGPVRYRGDDHRRVERHT